MEKTPRANRLHIAVFGRRNAGKSSLINALTNQDLALVSEVAGTTGDPVYKSMELLPFGPVVMIDTAGIDDTGQLGQLRVKKTRDVMKRTDLAIVVIDSNNGMGQYEKDLIVELEDREIPFVIVLNKIDLDQLSTEYSDIIEQLSDYSIRDEAIIPVSAQTGKGIDKLKECLVKKAPEDYERDYIIGDLITPGEVVVLVTPIDDSAPKGRLILPQVQSIRDIIDYNGISLVTKETELELTLDHLKDEPALVVTDSQAFGQVAEIVPEEILMTSFSILFARYKGDLDIYLRGAMQLNKLKPGSKILVAEACTHRRQDEDIGTVKIPNWMRERVCQDLVFENVSGREYPDNLKDYDLILHCGGCMLNRKEILNRIREADSKGIPVINYGMAIAYLHGILDRALAPFPFIQRKWNERDKNLKTIR